MKVLLVVIFDLIISIVALLITIMTGNYTIYYIAGFISGIALSICFLGKKGD